MECLEVLKTAIKTQLKKHPTWQFKKIQATSANIHVQRQLVTFHLQIIPSYPKKRLWDTDSSKKITKLTCAWDANWTEVILVCTTEHNLLHSKETNNILSNDTQTFPLFVVLLPGQYFFERSVWGCSTRVPWINEKGHITYQRVHR